MPDAARHDGCTASLERNGSLRVALFATCVVDQVMPEVGLAVLQVLDRHGVSAEFPPGQTCCGQPLFNSGYRPEARRVARAALGGGVCICIQGCRAEWRVFRLGNLE